jgi:hypothetical protein
MEALSPVGQERLVTTINEAVDHLVVAGDKINEALGILKCKQLQMISYDLESISDHIRSLSVDGPMEPFAEIPLEQSEIVEEF